MFTIINTTLLKKAHEELVGLAEGLPNPESGLCFTAAYALDDAIKGLVAYEQKGTPSNAS